MARLGEAHRIELIEKALNAANDRIDAFPLLSERSGNRKEKGMMNMVDEIFDRHYQAGRSELNRLWRTPSDASAAPSPTLSKYWSKIEYSGTLGSKAEACPLQLTSPEECGLARTALLAYSARLLPFPLE